MTWYGVHRSLISAFAVSLLLQLICLYLLHPASVFVFLVFLVFLSNGCCMHLIIIIIIMYDLLFTSSSSQWLCVFTCVCICVYMYVCVL